MDKTTDETHGGWGDGAGIFDGFEVVMDESNMACSVCPVPSNSAETIAASKASDAPERSATIAVPSDSGAEIAVGTGISKDNSVERCPMERSVSSTPSDNMEMEGASLRNNSISPSLSSTGIVEVTNRFAAPQIEEEEPKLAFEKETAEISDGGLPDGNMGSDAIEWNEYKDNYTKKEVPKSYSLEDVYAIAILVILSPLAMIVMPLAFTLHLIPLAFIRLYRILFLNRPLDIVHRASCAFQAFNVLVLIWSAPVVGVACLWVALVRLVNFVLTLPIRFCSSSKGKTSAVTLHPYNKRPGEFDGDDLPASVLSKEFGYIWPFADIVVAVLGAMERQGFLEFSTAVPFMIAVVPMYKHVVMANPVLYRNMEEVFINQWSEPLDATGDGFVRTEDFILTQRHLVECVNHVLMSEEENSVLLDVWPFMGFHQLPPPSRKSKTVAGMQFFNLKGPARCSMVSHTTVTRNIRGFRPRSHTAEWNLMQVRLLSWNPFYLLAGYVEVNIRKDGGWEHPMWLCADQSSRLHMQFLHSINLLFVELMYRFILYLREQKEFTRMSSTSSSF